MEAKHETHDAPKLEEGNGTPSQILKELSGEMTGPLAKIINTVIESEWVCMTGE